MSDDVEEPEEIVLFDDADVADEITDLASRFLDPAPSTSGMRLLGQIFIGVGALILLVGLFLLITGLFASQPTPQPSILVQTQVNVQLLFGGVFVFSSLSEFAIGAVLLSLAEIRMELAESRRTLAAILETHLAVFEKS